MLLHKQGLGFAERPATMRRRREGTSSIGLWHGGWYMVKVLLAIVMDIFKAPVRLKEDA